MTNAKTFVSVKVEGHKGTFTEIDSIRMHGKTYFLLESDQYGEDADHVAVYASGKLLVDGITGGGRELIEVLQRNLLKIRFSETLKLLN